MDDQEIGRILTTAQVLAVVGCSSNPMKEAHTVPRFLQQHGYRIVPVNPFSDEILGEPTYANVKDIPFSIDLVDVFRPSDQVGPVVDDALETDAKVIWMQLGIRNDEAAARARKAGRLVVQDRCLRSEVRRLGIPPRS